MSKFKCQIAIFVGIYFALRLFSFFFSPETPLHDASSVNSILAVGIFLLAVYLLIKKDSRGWYIVMLEMVLGGAGGFLSVGPLALRTSLLLASLLIYLGHQVYGHKLITTLRENRNFCIVAGILNCAAFFSALNGYFDGHNFHFVFSDFIPYLFIWYFLPLKELRAKDDFRQIAYSALIAAVIGNAIFLLLTLIGFSAGSFVLQGSYYHWFRDVALGKVTDLGMGYFRLVLNEHLLLVPVLLYFMQREILKIKYQISKILFISLLFILAVNLTRIYMLALVAGSLLLFSRVYWKRWLMVCLAVGFSFAAIFTATHLASTRGQSLGWEMFGLRLQSVIAPQIEESSLSRMLLLSKILDKIRSHPVLGTGLGDTVTVYSPALKTEITTSQFDWGYLEIFAEMGVVGLLIWMSLIIFSFYTLRKNDSAQFLTVGLGAMAVINLTSPAFFHVLGVVFLAVLLSQSRPIRN